MGDQKYQHFATKAYETQVSPINHARLDEKINKTMEMTRKSHRKSLEMTARSQKSPEWLNKCYTQR